MVLEDVGTPIVLAPLAGGPATPELCDAVGAAGGLGFLAFGYLDPDASAARLRAVSVSVSRFGVNVFVPGDPSSADLAPYLARMPPGAGAPRFDDDAFDAKLDLLRSE